MSSAIHPRQNAATRTDLYLGGCLFDITDGALIITGDEDVIFLTAQETLRLYNTMTDHRSFIVDAAREQMRNKERKHYSNAVL